MVWDAASMAWFSRVTLLVAVLSWLGVMRHTVWAWMRSGASFLLAFATPSLLFELEDPDDDDSSDEDSDDEKSGDDKSDTQDDPYRYDVLHTLQTRCWDSPRRIATSTCRKGLGAGSLVRILCLFDTRHATAHHTIPSDAVLRALIRRELWIRDNTKGGWDSATLAAMFAPSKLTMLDLLQWSGNALTKNELVTIYDELGGTFGDGGRSSWESADSNGLQTLIARFLPDNWGSPYRFASEHRGGHPDCDFRGGTASADRTYCSWQGLVKLQVGAAIKTKLEEFEA